MKKRKKFLVIIIFILIALGTFSFFVYKEHKEEVDKQLVLAKQKLLTKDIKSHFSNKVIVSKDTKLYKKNDNKYEEIGTVYKDTKLVLTNKNNESIDYNTKYFYIESIDLYISYKDVSKYDEDITIDDRYKKYLLFDLNIKTNDSVTLYNKDKTKKEYKLNYSLDLPVIIKDDDGVFVEYFNNLYFINNSDIASTYEKSNNQEIEANSIPVTCYHFIYFPGDTSCNEIICHSEEQIRSHFNYLSSNNYFTINTTELRLFIEGKLRLPKNTILVTIDDGARAEKFIPLLEEYKLNATLFLVSSWYPKETFASPYMEIASHTHDLHTGGKCPGGQGGWIKCLEHDALLADFKKSRETLDNTEAFCYPFYEYNNYTISVLKEAGFKMAFAGGQKKATRGIDLFQIPRITIHNSTTLNEYINYIS